MDKSYSLFRTSMQPSMYISPVYVFDNNTKNHEKKIKIENILNVEKPKEPSPVRSGGFVEYKTLSDDPTILRVSPINMIIRPISFSINDNEKKNDIIFRINTVPNQTSPKIYSKKIKKSNYKLKDNTPRKVKIFTEENKVFYINGNDFYRFNNMKNDIWWSSDELKLFRDMFIEDVNRQKRSQPWLSHKECVHEICK